MLVEVMVRWDREVIDEEKKLIDPDYKSEIKHYYEPMTLFLEDIRAYNRVDRIHTSIRFEKDLDAPFVIKVPYEGFQRAHAEAVGQMVKSIKIAERNTELPPDDHIEDEDEDGFLEG